MRQEDSHADTFHEPSPLVVTAESADRVDDSVDLLQAQAVHLLVQCLEVRPDLFVVVGATLVVALVEHSQNGVGVAVVGWMLFDVGF